LLTSGIIWELRVLHNTELEPENVRTTSGDLSQTSWLSTDLHMEYAYAVFETKNTPPITTDIDRTIYVRNLSILLLWFIYLQNMVTILCIYELG
jgi:hypothetical protein